MNAKSPTAIIIFFLFFTAGFLFRLYLASLYPHAPLFDENEYLLFAQDLRRQFLVASCCSRTYVYPFFLNIIFDLFGNNNFAALSVIQALMDTFSALLLYFISYQAFRKIHL